MYGVIGGEANKIEPGKRMLSSMTPTIVERNGALFMVVGTPGGSTIITSVFQTILNVIEHKMTMQEAVSARRFHSQWTPDVIFPENNALTKEDSVQLVKMGHVFDPGYLGGIGRVDAILVTPEGKLEGGADPRGDDAARGF
jgi:gamma-glutamyltranspeptidase/glutathione hydrolase